MNTENGSKNWNPGLRADFKFLFKKLLMAIKPFFDEAEVRKSNDIFLKSQGVKAVLNSTTLFLCWLSHGVSE